MNISRISRSIVVAIFVTFVIFLSYLDVLSIIQKSSEVIVTSNLIKLGYAILMIILVMLYLYIKTKLYKMKIKRKISFIYRYIYLFIVVILNSFFVLYKTLPDISDKAKILYILILLITAFIIKKIIFNVSKSDTLSVLAMFGFSMIQNVILDKTMYLNSLSITLTFVVIILLLQLIIDELKQRGIKNIKYIVFSIFLGIVIGINSLLGVSIIVYFLIAIGLLLITVNLDNTHISFAKKIMNSITQQNREKLYKIERININKLLYVIFIFTFVSVIVFFSGKFVLNKVSDKVNLQYVNNIQQNIEQNKISNLDFNLKQSLKDILSYGKELVSFSKTYYLIIFIYIILIEILAFSLRRRYDTKSTLMKLILLLVFISSSIFKINILYMQPIFTTLFILIAIVNTSNIYLNREERVKMLVA